MDVFSMVFGIVLVGTLGSLFGQALRNRSKALDLKLTQSTAPAGSDQQATMQRELAQLRERVAALEAIVTEPSYDLKRKFRELERDGSRSS